MNAHRCIWPEFAYVNLYEAIMTIYVAYMSELKPINTIAYGTWRSMLHSLQLSYNTFLELNPSNFSH
jgi:hypothetical protein